MGADAKGTTGYAAVRPAHLLAATIPLPLLEEQRRLVTRIEAVARRIAAARELRERANEETRALADSFVERLLSEPGWTWSPVENLLTDAGLRNGLSVKSSENGSGVRCLTLSAIREGHVNLGDAKPVPLSSDQAGPYLVRPGDVFVTRGNGSRDLVGRAGLVTEESDDVIFPDLLIRVPVDPRRMLGSFFVEAWNGTETRSAILDRAKTTSGIWKVNHGHVSAISIPVPPMEQQEPIVAHIAAFRCRLSALQANQKASAQDLERLLPAVLGRAFSGRL